MAVRNRRRWVPSFAVPPGETIRETFEERGWTQVSAAERMGIAQSYLSDVVRGHRAISALFAVRLEALTGITAEFWAHLQADYDIAEVRQSVEGKAILSRVAASEEERRS